MNGFVPLEEELQESLLFLLPTVYEYEKRAIYKPGKGGAPSEKT